jgi:glycosyltransferase involved in cell wall biosynthesis
MKTIIKNDYQLIVVAPKDKFIDKILTMNCNYIDINIDNQGSNPIVDLKLVYSLYKIYKDISPDIIIHYTIKPNIYGSFAARLSKKISLSIIPGLGYTFINDNITSQIAKLLYKLALKTVYEVWFLNNDDSNTFIENQLVDKSKVKVINGEGINTTKYKLNFMNKPDNIIFLMIARVLKDKGIYEYIESIRILKKQYPSIEFQLLGSVDAQNPTAIDKQEVEEWVENKLINYLGTTNDVRPYIEKATCIVLPSYREGLSMSLMEAASMSKPIIASNITGCKELIDDGINGYLCEVRNVKDLADKMEMMIKLSEDERKIIGQAGRDKMVKEFNEKIVIDKYLNSIKEILK